MRLVGILACTLLVAFAFVYASLFFGTKALEDFIYSNDSIALIGVILSIYLATSCAFIALLSSLKKGKTAADFPNTLQEIKSNTYLVFLLFLAFMFITTCLPKPSSYWLIAPMAIFLLFLYATYELSIVIFTINKK